MLSITNTNVVSASIDLAVCGVAPVNVSGRISAAVDHICKNRPAKPPAPLWGWLERFAKTNPALSNLASFLAGVVITIIGLLLKMG
jgi:hypothetical protein